MTKRTSHSNVRQAKVIVYFLSLFWIIVGVASFTIGLGIFPDSANNWLPIVRLIFIFSGVAGILLALFLATRQAWARPAAVMYHLWFGGAILLTTWQSYPFTGLINDLPVWFTRGTWTWLIGSTFVIGSISSLASAYYLTQPVAWDAFSTKRPRRLQVCETCGATRKKEENREFCPHCDTTNRIIYFLQPVLRNARRILLMFEPGHARIRIGRSVGNGEAWIDTNENKRYRTISRHHADIELDFRTGDMALHKAFTSQEVMVDNQLILMSEPVKLGSLIQLGKVQFVLGNSDYEPILAYFVDQGDENMRHLLRFNGANNEQRIGRAADNDVVLAGMRDVAHHHATIIFDPGGEMFFIRNESERNPIYIDGHLLEAGRAQPLSTEELIVVQLGSHNFNFLPVLYKPSLSEATYA
ncbi:MAG: FHA domain-containing protein [Methylococcales bacterium]|nr:FHA domain-containing protein [Methylococcales bacterium]